MNYTVTSEHNFLQASKTQEIIEELLYEMDQLMLLAEIDNDAQSGYC